MMKSNLELNVILKCSIGKKKKTTFPLYSAIFIKEIQ